MEERNVIRVLNSNMRDVDTKRLKVDVQAGAIERTGLGTRVIRIRRNLWDPEVVRAVANATCCSDAWTASTGGTC